MTFWAEEYIMPADQRAALDALGLPAGLVEALAGIISWGRDNRTAGIPSRDERVAALQPVLDHAKALATALADLDEFSTALLDAHMFSAYPDADGTARTRRAVDTLWGAAQSALEQERARDDLLAKRPAHVVARRVVKAFVQHGVGVGSGPDSIAPKALAIVLRAIGGPEPDALNLIRQALRQKVKAAEKDGHD